MAVSETSICNMALGRIGSNRLTNMDTDTIIEAIWCRAFFDEVRDGLLRSHIWKFAVKTSELSEDAATPDFQYDNQFDLPADFLRAWYVYDTTSSWQIEAQWLLTDDDEVNLVYIAQITDPTKFDSLFVELLALKLAINLCMPLTHDRLLRRELVEEYQALESKARAVNLQENQRIGRSDLQAWNDQRNAGSSVTQQDKMC